MFCCTHGLDVHDHSCLEHALAQAEPGSSKRLEGVGCVANCNSTSVGGINPDRSATAAAAAAAA
jgi:hypothetical protein